MSYTLVNQVSAGPHNCNVGYNNSWIKVGNNASRDLFAQASYVTNFEDFTVSLSAGDVNIGSVEIKDGNSGLRADVVDAGSGLNALRVISQDLESNVDDITIGDKSGNFATVDAATSALNVRIVNSNTIGVSGSLTVTNPVTSITVTNPVTAVNAVVTNTVGVSGSLTVTNPVTSVNAVVTNTVGVSAINLPVTVTNTIETVTTTNPVQLDAFGRFRVSTPLTLFDSSHRYKDNNLWASLTAVNGTTYAFNQNQGLMDLTVTAASGSSVIRETTKVFTYQPGKSLLVLNTFVFAPSATNLRQRTGYFGNDNGIYFQLDDGVVSFVERSLVTGSPSETTVPMSAWNIDKMDGTGPSGFTLDITKAQISWMDIEWLGVGTVRCGFVIDGKFVHCHSFHHANRIASTYITTASLPVRYEITNKAATTGATTRTMKQICSSVISEGGYELHGLQQAVGTPITGAVDLPATGTLYTVISIRLKSNRLDAIVILTALSLMGMGNGPEYNWQVRASATTSGGTWTSAGDDSAVEYKIDGGTVSGGRILASGFFSATNQSAASVDILKEALFKFQLERNGLTGDRYELTLVCATNSAGADVFASMDWEEVSR